MRILCPGRYAFPVNNSAYTNAAAAIALSFATEARAPTALFVDFDPETGH